MDFDTHLIHLPSCTFLGGVQPGGTYLLQIRVQETVRVRFGRFQQGAPILVPAGDYLYLGSALGRRGSMSLPRRLLRHATRTTGKPAHALRPQLRLDLQTIFPEQQFTLPTSKKMRWHVDYLLDEMATELVQIIIIANGERLERELGQRLLAYGETAVLVPGLGATDIPGNTHLLALHVPESWWQTLVTDITV